MFAARRGGDRGPRRRRYPHRTVRPSRNQRSGPHRRREKLRLRCARSRSPSAASDDLTSSSPITAHSRRILAVTAPSLVAWLTYGRALSSALEADGEFEALLCWPWSPARPSPVVLDGLALGRRALRAANYLALRRVSADEKPRDAHLDDPVRTLDLRSRSCSTHHR